jgi:hypothetical protein
MSKTVNQRPKLKSKSKVERKISKARGKRAKVEKCTKREEERKKNRRVTKEKNKL